MPDLLQVVKHPVFVGEVPKKPVVVRALGESDGGQGSLHLWQCQHFIKAIRSAGCAVLWDPATQLVGVHRPHVFKEKRLWGSEKRRHRCMDATRTNAPGQCSGRHAKEQQ